MVKADKDVCFEVRKNSFSVIRARRTFYEGNDLLDLRVWSEDLNGNTTPTRQGVSLQFERLPELLETLQDLQAASDGAAENETSSLS